MTVTEARAGDPPVTLRHPDYWQPTIGLVIVVTVVATEAMAVATVMPTVVRALHGLRYYSWGFTAYLLADVVGMVDAGRRTDRHGPTPALLGGLVLFAVGLIVASSAPDIGVFLTGRVLQGLGGGSMIVSVYVVVARAFPESLHPKVFAALSGAWVVPSLVGPALAGLVTSAFGWRWVFAGIAPLAIAGALLLVPILRSIPAVDGTQAKQRGGLATGLLVAAGLGLIQLAAEWVNGWAVLLVAVGAVILIPQLRRLFPSGALRMSRGLPAVIVLRGITTCAFFGAEAYLPLTLTRVHGGTASVVGIPLTVAALGWSTGSWWQGRTSRSRTTLMSLGLLLVAIGVGVLLVVAQPGVTLWLAIPIWTVAGLGMGIVMPTISVLQLELSPDDEQGANSAALQISDMVGSIIGIAAAGALVTGLGLHRISTAATIADLVLAGVAVFGSLVAPRTRPLVRR